MYIYKKKYGTFARVKNDYKLQENEYIVDDEINQEHIKKTSLGYKAEPIITGNKVIFKYIETESVDIIKLNKLRSKREPLLKAFDVYKSNVFYGIISEKEVDHNVIISWYNDLLDLKPSAFENIPVSIQNYLKGGAYGI